MDALMATTGMTSMQLGGALAAIGAGAVLMAKMFGSPEPATSSGGSGKSKPKKKENTSAPAAKAQVSNSQPAQVKPKSAAAATQSPKSEEEGGLTKKQKENQKKKDKKKQKEKEAKLAEAKEQAKKKREEEKHNGQKQQAKKKAVKIKEVVLKNKKAGESGDDWSDDDNDDDFLFVGAKKKSPAPARSQGPLSEKQKKAAKRQEQVKLEENRKETARTMVLQGAVAAPLKNLERWDNNGFEVVARKKGRSPKAAVSPVGGGNQSASKQGGSSAQAATSTSVEVEVDPKNYGLIIGEKGATLMKFQTDYGVKIDVPKRDDPKKTVTISSQNKDAITKAQKALKILIQGGSAVSEIFCPPEKIGVVIGPGGKNIKALQEAFKVRVNTPERNSGSNKVIITGDKPGVKGAKEAVKMLLSQGFSSATHPGWVMNEVAVDFEYFRFVIGPSGQTIKSIQGDTKTRVNLPQTADGSSSMVTVVGPKEGVERAIAQIEKAVARGKAKQAEFAASAAVTEEAGFQRNSYAMDANDPNAFSDDEF